MATRKGKARTPQPPTTRARARRGAAAVLAQSRASEVRYRSFFDNANDALALISVEGIIQDVNRGAERLLGWTKAELIGQHVGKVATPATVAQAEERSRRFRAGEKLPSSIFAAELLRKDGRTVLVEARTRAMRDAAGTLIGYQGIYRDLSERQQAAEALRRSEERYRSIFAACPDFVYVTDLTGRLVDANPALLGWQGLSLAELQQRHFLDFFAGDNEEEIRAAFSRLTQGLAVRELLVRAKNAQGEIRAYEVNAIPLHDQHGRITAVLSVARDVSARYEIEAALTERRRLHDRIADALPQLVYVYDLRALRLRLVNAQLTPLLGYAAADLSRPGAGLFGEWLHPEDRAAVARRHQELTRSGALPGVQEFRVRHANGAYRWLQSREVIFTRTPEGEPWELLGLAEDITDRKRLEQVVRETPLPAQRGKQLQAFRERLGMTQPEFGARFGGYTQGQMSTYETGRAEVPLELVLRIREAGYPLEAVLGATQATVLEETVAYLAASRRERVLQRQLAATLTRFLERDEATIERVLRAFDRPLPALEGEQRLLHEQLVRLLEAPLPESDP